MLPLGGGFGLGPSKSLSGGEKVLLTCNERMVCETVRRLIPLIILVNVMSLVLNCYTNSEWTPYWEDWFLLDKQREEIIAEIKSMKTPIVAINVSIPPRGFSFVRA